MPGTSPVRGIAAARFDHRDSRAGDPDLHTHAAISAKVQTLTGDWRALDAKPLYAAKVYLSEVYTTSLTARLRDLGLAMEPIGRDGKRPIYEIAGLDPALLARWSTRRRHIQAWTADLVEAFEHDHERPPTKAERLELAQQATLDTRPAKHGPRSEADQRAAWHAEAVQLLGRAGLDRMLHGITAHRRPAPPVVDEAWVARTAQQVINTVEAERSSWTPWNVRAEALRQVRAAAIPLDQITRVAEAITERALAAASIPIRTTRAQPVEPAPLLRPDGVSVYEQPAASRYTSRRILYAERRLVDTAGRTGGRTGRSQLGHPRPPPDHGQPRTSQQRPTGHGPRHGHLRHDGSNWRSRPPGPGRPPPCAPWPPPGPPAAAPSSASPPQRRRPNNSAPSSARARSPTTSPSSSGPSATARISPDASGPTRW